MTLWEASQGSECAPFWQRRFYDFNVWSEEKQLNACEKAPEKASPGGG